MMNSDLLQDHFSDNIDSNVIKRTFLIIRVGMILVIIYSLFLTLDWYLVLTRYYAGRTKIVFDYRYQVQPLIALILISVSTLSWHYHLKATRLILRSLDEREVKFFNEGYRFTYKATLLSLISIITAIISVAFRLLLKI